jgi:hypothetical protein
MTDFTNKPETLMREHSSIERVLLDVTEERGRQIAKGFDAAHDDEEHMEALPRGAAAKLLHTFRHASALGVWPWPYAAQSKTPFKGTTRQLLIEAAAMIVAQVEKMDRAQPRFVPCARCRKEMRKRPTDGFTICAPCWEAEIAAIPDEEPTV